MKATEPGRAQVAAALVEDVLDVRRGAVAVVGQAGDHHRDAAGGVALVDELLEVVALARRPRRA